MQISPTPRRAALLIRAGVFLVLIAGGLLALGLAARYPVIPTDRRGLMSWAATTDPAGAVLPLLVVAVVVVAGVSAGAGALYLVCHALGWVRAAQAVGHLVLPQLRRRLDRLVAVGVVASTLVAGTTGSAAYADVVREPEPVSAPAPDVVRVPDSAEAPEAPIVDREPAIPFPAVAPPDLPDVAASDGPQPEIPAPAQPPVAPSHPAPQADTDSRPQDAHTPSAGGTPSAQPGAAGGEGLIRDVPPSVEGPIAPASSAGGGPGPGTARAYTVLSGDSLWSVAAAHLATVRSVEAATLSDHDVATYWVRVVEDNRSTLRSGNPNLIYAGEVITLPAL